MACFAASPFNAIHTQLLLSSDSYDKKNISLVSYDHDIIPDFEQTISSGANRSSTGSDASGSGAIISSKT